MLTTRYTTIEEIMEIVHRDYMFEANRSEVAEWIWQCVGYLGIPYGMEEKIIDSEVNELFKVEDFKTPLPVDCYQLKNIKHKGLDYPLKKSTDIYLMNRLMEQSITTGFTVTGTNIVENETSLDFDNTAYITFDNQVLSKESFVYLEKANDIYYGFKEGHVIILYDAFPIDEYGYPKIPDDAKYIRAITTFVAKKIAYRMYMKDLLQKNKYDEIVSAYSFAAGAAKTKAITPDVDMMEAIRQVSSKLVPLYSRHADSFAARTGVIYTNTDLSNFNI